MLVSLILILLITAAGFVLTYLFADEETFLWRLSAGNIIGSAIFGTVGFFIANFAGLSIPVVLIALAVSALPLVLFRKKEIYKIFRRDWDSAKGKLQNTNRRRAFGFVYYLFFFILFWFFFDRAIFETAEGIFTGGSQNLGDLPFHLGAIYSFTDGNNFPPQNPSYAGARFSYPFIADFLTACFMKFGADLKNAMLVQNVAWAFSLLVILEKFVFNFTNSRLAGKIAPALLFFSGGFGFLWFFKDFAEQSKGFFEFLNNLPRDYTISENFRWGNSLVTLFITQRSLLIGMPLTIIVLNKLWNIFSTENEKRIVESERTVMNEKSLSIMRFPLSVFLTGLLAGTLPLVHLHSLAVLFVVGVFLLILKPERIKDWLAFGIGVGVVAVPELVWAMSGTATRTSEFIAFHFGWDSKDQSAIWFWIKNTGLFIPLLIFGIVQIWQSKVQSPKSKVENATHHSSLITQHLLFFLPFLFCFVVANLMKLAPWEWDNIKVLIYWFTGSLPFVAFVLAWLHGRGKIFKFIAAGCFLILIFSGALDVWRGVSGQIKYKVFDANAVKIADQIKKKAAPDALFLNAPTYNSAVVLSGRRSLMRYTGHLSSHGIDYTERENDLRAIYEGNATASMLLRKNDIDYVIVSPEERAALAVNEDFFRKYPVIAESGEYRVYKIK